MSDVIFRQSQPVRCPVCEKAFDFEVELTEAHFEKELWIDVDCHHCQAALTLDFEPYLMAETIVHKSANSLGSGGLTLDLPDEILAKKR